MVKERVSEIISGLLGALGVYAGIVGYPEPHTSRLFGDGRLVLIDVSAIVFGSKQRGSRMDGSGIRLCRVRIWALGHPYWEP